MPSLSRDRELDQLLAESQDTTRYREIAMRLRYLTLSRPVAYKAKLTDDEGREWVAGGELDDSGKLPVSTAQIGASATVPAGTILRTESGDAVELCVEVVGEAGGVWDTQRKDWRLHPDGTRYAALSPVTVDLTPAQIVAGRWLAKRVRAFRDREKHHQNTLELFSDRRAGKTFLGVLGVLMMAIDCPQVGKLPLVAWMVSTMHSSRDELDRIIKAVLPPELYTFRELPKRQYMLANGALIAHKTIDDVEGQLRSGYVDICLLNEAALMPLDAYRLTLRGTQDRGGFVVLTTNTPMRTRGAWVVRLANGAEEDARLGKPLSIELVKLDPRLNTAIEQEAKQGIDQSLRHAISGDEGLDEGVILEADQKLLAPPWDPNTHIITLPRVGFVDVTAYVTQQIQGQSFQYIAGADFQQQCAGSVFKIYAKSHEPADLAEWMMVGLWSVFFRSGGDENDLVEALRAANYTPQNTLIIGDCSGGWQAGDHGYGPKSFAVLQAAGYTILGPTKKKSAKGFYSKNPDVEKSVAQLRNQIQRGRFLVEQNQHTGQLQKALAGCDARVDIYGNLRPKGTHSHLVDTCRYPLWWLSTGASQIQPAAQVPNYVIAAAARRR